MPAFSMCAAFACLTLAWVFVQPPFDAPDEKDHFARTVSVSQGHLVGPRARYGPARLSTAQRAWLAQVARAVTIPAKLAPSGYGCAIRTKTPRRNSAGCLRSLRPASGPVRTVTLVGTYQPLPYLLPAAVVDLGTSPAGGDRLARLAGAVPCVALLCLAVALLWDGERRATSLLGIGLAATPMTLFSAATLNGSGLEICAGIALTAALLRLGRAERSPPWVWVGVAIAGALLALSRSTGPVWLLLDSLLVFTFVGRRRLTRVVRLAPLRAAVTAAVVVAALVANRIWESLYGPHVTVGFSGLSSASHDGLTQLKTALQSAVGWFGYLEVKLPAVVIAAWLLMTLAVLLVAARRATPHQRRALALAAVAAVVVPVVLYVGVVRHTGFGLQGRHVLALLATVPLISGDVLSGRAGEGLRRLTVAVLAAAAVIQMFSLLFAARVAATGRGGSWWLLGSTDWSPPGGWGPWLALGLVGSAGLVAAALAWRAGPSHGGTFS